MEKDNEWHYSINYGPEGEENYANVYKGREFVSNLRIRHAMDICIGLRSLEQLRTELERLKKQTGWQDIGTCPDDGKPVLLAYKNSMKKYVAKNDHIPDWCFEARPYCILGSGGAKSWHGEATHWQPLPQPPALSSTKDNGEKI